MRLAPWHTVRIKLKTQAFRLFCVCRLYKEHESRYAFGICCLKIFLSAPPHRFPLRLTLEGSNCLKEVKLVPLSGNPLDTPIRQRGRAGAWNFNQKENIEFVEFENVPLKQNAPNPLWYGKLLLLPPSWIKLFFLSVQLSSPGHYDPHYMSCAYERKTSTSLYLPFIFFFFFFYLFSPESLLYNDSPAEQWQGGALRWQGVKEVMRRSGGYISLTVKCN